MIAIYISKVQLHQHGKIKCLIIPDSSEMHQALSFGLPSYYALILCTPLKVLRGVII